MFKKFLHIFKAGAGLGELGVVAERVNALEPEIRPLSDEGLKKESLALRDALKGIDDEAAIRLKLDEFLPRAFALVREAARRTLGQRHFDVQLMGGVALHQGKIAEMRTGEGKTLSATLPVYLNALAGKGVHVVTVNEYLAKRDTVWMGQVYHSLGLTVSCLIHEGARAYDPHFRVPRGAEALVEKEIDITGSYLIQEEFLRPATRQEAYQTDITYGTNHEFGFDYLRDNLAYNLDQQTQKRGPASAEATSFAEGGTKVKPAGRHFFAVIDEVDSILIDEARTPLIISAPDTESSQLYKTFAKIVDRLEKETDYLVDEKLKSADITQEGINKVEKALQIKNLYEPENLRLTHYLQESLRAKALFLRDRDYVVKNNEIIIVDQFTGRLMLGRRYSGGLHQAIEAKEEVLVQQESRTYAQISIQNYFRLYKKLSGMTGTAATSAEEFDKVYGLDVVTIPTNMPMVRKDEPDLIYKTSEAKFEAIIKDIKERNKRGQPILIGTVSIEKNEDLSRRLARAGIKHELLNAKNNEREGAIIAQAGRLGAITVATNVAGRGVDIILGGTPPNPEEAKKVKDAGGLHVIGTERHESRRIDNQLRGRAGRQGDPGSSQFFLSLEDDLMRIFGGERIGRLMETLKVPEEMPIQAGMLNRVIAQAQSKVEGLNFDARKHLLDYDDVLNRQRTSIYRKRQEILETGTSPILLGPLDMFWMNHLENMEALQESVRIRAYGQHDPLVEYRREGHLMFQELLKNFDQWMEENKEKIEQTIKSEALNPKQVQNSNNQNSKQFNVSNLGLRNSPQDGLKVGRNDLCPCGAINPATGQVYKYKKCGLINAPYHKK